MILAESDYGHRDKRGHYKPDERVSYPPVFVWPLKPIGALKWVFSIPGYFVPWNLFYVLVGLLSWFYFSPQLEAYAQLNVKVFLIAFARNSVLVALYFGAFHYRLYTQRAQD